MHLEQPNVRNLLVKSVFAQLLNFFGKLGEMFGTIRKCSQNVREIFYIYCENSLSLFYCSIDAAKKKAASIKCQGPGVWGAGAPQLNDHSAAGCPSEPAKMIYVDPRHLHKNEIDVAITYKKRIDS